MKFSLSIIISFLLVFNAMGQKGTMEFKRVELLKNIADQSNSQLFFKQNAELDQIVTIDTANRSFTSVLDEIFVDSELSYILYAGHSIVIVPRSLSENNISSAYLKAKEIQSNSKEGLRTVGDPKIIPIDGRAILSGSIYDEGANEPLIGATVIINPDNAATVTDAMGNFEIPVEIGQKEVEVSFLGYGKHIEKINLLSSGRLSIKMKFSVQLEGVTISARGKDENISNVNVGVETVNIKSLEKKPILLGEIDIVKSFVLEPGVSTISDGAPGINVRGGNVDQNLIQVDESIFFNTSHALGFFSTIGSDLINGATLYKGSMPAQYGGRLASVVQMGMKDGNFDKMELKGSIGAVSSQMYLSTPIINDKLSLMVNGRISYVNWLLNSSSTEEVKNSASDFYDLTGRITFRPNLNHIFSLSGFTSDDDFVFNKEFGFQYSSKNIEFLYRGFYGDKLTSRFSATVHDYRSSRRNFEKVTPSQLEHQISYLKLKEVFTINLENNQNIKAGASVIFNKVNPNSLLPLGDSSIIAPIILDEENGKEMSAFASYNGKLGENFEFSTGIRFVLYQLNGPYQEYQYELDKPSGQIIDQVTKEGVVQSYQSIEPRASLRYSFGDDFSLKMGYSRSAQFLNQLFNTDAPVPTSQWQLSTRYLKPQRAHNLSLGIFKNFGNNSWETNIEVYGRKIDDAFDYKDFADLIANDHLETELLSGEGRSYGLEAQIKRNSGTLNGWVSYSYSKSEYKIDGVNNGNWYPTPFDITHNISMTLNYEFNKRRSLTLNTQFNTGRPTTSPLGSVQTRQGNLIPVFTNRNAVRIPETYRVDLSYNLLAGDRSDKKVKTSWSFTIYNLLGRKNPYSIFYTRATYGLLTANQISILGTIFPSISMRFHFK